MADTFGVAIHVTDADLQFVVHVPSDIDSGWSDPEEFQRLVERVVWDRLDRDAVLRDVATAAPAGETVSLGTVTLESDGTVVDDSLEPPAVAGDDDADRDDATGASRRGGGDSPEPDGA
jgi:hypothetical protein